MNNNKASQTVNHIAIVGGGTAGWMTAATLGQHFSDQNVKITLIESSQLGTVGVGEATIPTLRRFYQKLGFSDPDIIKATGATVKLGIEFRNWRKQGHSFIHPFGLYGQDAKGLAFQHFWCRAKQQGLEHDIADYSLGVNLARANKFFPPDPKPKTRLAIFDWALHFDAARFADVMKQHALKHQIRHIDQRITQVNQCPDSGNIATLLLENGEAIDADLFIDCSGFHGLLMDKTLKTPYLDWSKWLICDSAVAVQSERKEAPITRTLSTAKTAGWQWSIPLQHRQGNGMVYCSDFIDRDAATTSMTSDVSGKILHEPRHFSFTAGRRERAWNKNCIAVGLSSGFLEPLESTSIALIETAIERITLSFQGNQYRQQDIDRFNEVSAMEYERVRDFIILHYKLNQRVGEPMWDHCRNMQVPDTLAEKMQQYQSKAELNRMPWEIFGPDSWIAIYHGFDFTPQDYHSQAEQMPWKYLQNSLQQMRNAISSTVNDAPDHEVFLKQYGGYQAEQSEGAS